MTEQSWHPGKIMETSGVYWQTCTLHAAVKLGVFTAIGETAKTADAIARELETDPAATGRLLHALTAMALLEKTDDRFANTQVGKTCLVDGAPGYLGYMIMHHHHLMESWARMDESVRTGRPVRSRSSFADPKRREAFLMGMFNNAMMQAPGLVKALDLSDRRHLLDLGGGPGTYAIHFCQENPRLRATVYDLATTRPFAEKTIARFSMEQRIDFIDGDYVTGAIPGQYDVVWMSHVLHGEGPGVCAEMIRKAVSTLSAGGMILVHDFILDNTLDGPLFAALFSLNMLLGTDSGQAYCEADIMDMLAGAGVGHIRRHAFRGPTSSGIISGTVDG